MWKWLISTGTAGNMVSDVITHAAVFGGGFLASSGFFPHCTATQIAAGACSDYQAYLGSAIFLGGLLWKWIENREQAKAK